MQVHFASYCKFQEGHDLRHPQSGDDPIRFVDSLTEVLNDWRDIIKGHIYPHTPQTCCIQSFTRLR